MRNNNKQTDPRFRIAHREALIGCGLAVINILWWYGFAYGLGSKPPEQYTYILGFPAWFFYSCIGGFVLMVVLVVFVVKFMLKEVPLDDEEKEEGSQ
ncbi:sodium:pantothenate symporter [Compostibacillus humi]|uniref:Sodium:pantothenate symporter n=1 Tax=Compostibacillus humi TaxID=1245525 RepID=A0A8J2ZP10_9BACI|nr:YhdT family protein [Compostibacillus humi]GGH67974.1 sodium:pantothenate symporter [Compostibacillus humi]HLT54992.1 YhdT family protein [Bacillota bacterium]